MFFAVKSFRYFFAAGQKSNQKTPPLRKKS